MREACRGVHQDEALDLLRRHVAAPGEIQEIETGANIKVPQVALLGTREDLDGARVKLLGRHHGGHGVEVGVQVGGDHLQGAGRGGRLAVIMIAAHERGWAFSCAFFKARRVQMGVDLGGGQIGMAQQQLDDPEVGPPGEQMGGHGVAQGMRAQAPQVLVSGHSASRSFQNPWRLSFPPRPLTKR